jgi:hypothetical protein
MGDRSGLTNWHAFIDQPALTWCSMVPVIIDFSHPIAFDSKALFLNLLIITY